MKTKGTREGTSPLEVITIAQSVALNCACSVRAVVTKKRSSSLVPRVEWKPIFPRTRCISTNVRVPKGGLIGPSPPPQDSIREMIFDCSNVKEVHNIPQDEHMPTHGGYHYSSTAVEWLKLIVALKTWEKTGVWTPDVSLNDGLRAVEMGMMATASIVNDRMHHGNDADYKRAQSCPVHD